MHHSCSYLLNQIAGQVARMERSGDENLGLYANDQRFARLIGDAIHTSTMCFWNSLSGPSLSSETCSHNVSDASQNSMHGIDVRQTRVQLP